MQNLIMLFIGIALCACEMKPSPSKTIFLQENNNGQSSILGGQQAPATKYPFIVNIWLNSPDIQYHAHHCAGSLIGPRWVLTAAHCVLEEASEASVKIIAKNKFELYIGDNHISGTKGSQLKVKNILIHPEFSWPHHDIALLELTEPVKNPSLISLFPEDVTSLSPSTQATVIGWGLTDIAGKNEGEFLNELTRPLLSREECQKDPFTEKRSWTIGTDMVCLATRENRNASCPGDSGGPLVIYKDTLFYQIGVVSWGSACSGTKSINISNVEGHASVSDAYPWIQKTMNSR